MTRRQRTALHVAGAFVVALALRALLAAWLDPSPSWDGVIYERAARMLAAGDGYTVRMYAPSWRWALPTAFYPPGWPAVLGAWKALGLGDLALQSLLGALAVPLAAALGARARGHAGARTAGWVVALWPGGILGAASWMSEPLFTVTLAGGLLALSAPRSTAARALGLVLLGLAAYVRPTALPIAGLALAVLLWPRTPRDPRTIGRSLLALAAALAVIGATLAPWLARNADAVGEPVLTTNAGANLHVGALSARFVPIPDAVDCPPGIRELARQRCHTGRALAVVRADPLAWSLRGAQKIFHTFGYEASPALQLAAGLDRSPRAPAFLALAGLSTVYWLGLVALAVHGARRSRRRVVLVVAAAALALALTHFVFVGGDRYHLPLVPLLAALAAGGLSSLAASRRGRRSRSRGSSA
ncbi:MAG: hypothetical protein AB7S26_41670 [Sandaracinaceae bacterium]